jgi:hypothetical protein
MLPHDISLAIARRTIDALSAEIQRNGDPVAISALALSVARNLQELAAAAPSFKVPNSEDRAPNVIAVDFRSRR